MSSKIKDRAQGSNTSSWEETFIDGPSQKVFRRFKYFDHTVIQDVETGRINVSKFIVLTTPAKRKTDRDISEFKRSGEDYELVLNIGKEELISKRKSEMKNHEVHQRTKDSVDNEGEKPSDQKGQAPLFIYGEAEIQSKEPYEPSLREIENFLFIEYNKGYGREEVRGTYTPIKAFQIIALWADKKHKLAILDLIWQINEKAILDQVSAYDKVKALTDQLKEENDQLRRQNDELGNQNIRLNNKIKALNAPFNQSDFPSVIWFRPDKKGYFQVRYDRVGGSAKALYVFPIPNTKDVKVELMKRLEKEELIVHFPRKHLIDKSNMNRVIEILNEICSDRPFVPITKEEKKSFIDEKLQEIRRRPFNAQIEGVIYEYEIIQRHDELIPWKMIPDKIRYQKNEKHGDKGIDAIEISDKGEIITIVQIKHHRDSYLRKEEIQSFLTRCQESRYASIKKKLILHGCKLGPKLQTSIESLGVEISIE